LVFSDDPLVAVDLALDAVLKCVSRFGEQANDFEQCPFFGVPGPEQAKT
jgi:hypothetical protein